MELRVLGAHNMETRNTRLTSLLIDGSLALDAGSLTSALSLEEQDAIGAVLLSHRHYDHIRDLPTLGLNTQDSGKTVDIHGLDDTLDCLRVHLMGGAMYPDFTRRPSQENPKYRLNPVEPGKAFATGEYRVLPAHMRHGPPAVGYLVSSEKGGSVLFTGDVGAELALSWPTAPVGLLAVEVTFPDRLDDRAHQSGHLTPSLLHRELRELKENGKAIPRVVAIHMNPAWEGEIRRELALVSVYLGVQIEAAYEGMLIRI